MAAPLAVLGAPPAFDQPLHVGAPNLPERAAFQRRLDDLLDRRWLTNRGPYVEEFERAVADLGGVAHCVATCNATEALGILARALGLRGEVIVPSWTFVATAHALRWQEIRPVFADVDPATHTLDPRSVRSQITPHTTGILGVHLWGESCDAEALGALGAEHDLPVFYDAAHALACDGPDGPATASGAASVLSFHATKFLNTFEGGAILTDDDDLAERCRLMTNFGFVGEDQVVHLGVNGKMSEVSAAMGLASLESSERVIAHNRTNLDTYAEGFDALPGLRVRRPPPDRRHNRQYVVVEVDPALAPLTRDQLVDVLRAERVNARRYFSPGVHRMEPYRSEQPHAGLTLPVTEQLAQTVMTLPNGSAVRPSDAARITELLATALDHARHVRRALAAPETPAALTDLEPAPPHP